MTFRTTFRDSLSSRQIALIDLPSEKYARRTFAIVSTISIPASASQNHGSQCGPSVRGSRLDADHPENGVPIARRNTYRAALTPAVRCDPTVSSIFLSMDLDDEALIAAIPAANLGDCTALATEAARRRLAAAIPALEALCRRFAGFGIDRVVPEQSAALRALAVIGSRDAAQAVSLLIVRGVVQGPALGLAVAAAAQLHASLPADVLRSLLRHADPHIRANACRCACRQPELIAVMIDLLDDLNRAVARSAACASDKWEGSKPFRCSPACCERGRRRK